jgi:hypothetical protein
MLGFNSKIAAVVLAVLTALCLLFAGIDVYARMLREWSSPYSGGGMCHAAACLILAAIPLVNFILLLIIGVRWLRNARGLFFRYALHARDLFFPHGLVGGWFAILLVGAISYFVSDQQYAAAAVVLGGPGPQSVKLQRDAANRDSWLLLNVLIMRGAEIEKNLLCYAASADSPSVLARLIELGAQLNEQNCTVNGRYTALHDAVDHKAYRAAEGLVKAGARVDIPNVRGMTPLDLAVTRGDERMISILKQ